MAFLMPNTEGVIPKIILTFFCLFSKTSVDLQVKSINRYELMGIFSFKTRINMKQLIFLIALFSVPSFAYGQKITKISASIDKNYGYRFDRNGFSIGIPIEFKKEMSSFSIAFNYSRKHNLTAQNEPFKTDTISCIFCGRALYNTFHATRQFKMDYISIPFEYKRYFNHRKEFFYKVGAYGGFAFNGQVSNFVEERNENALGLSPYRPQLYTDKPFSNLDFSYENIKRFDAGYILGIGFTKSIVDVTLRFEESFINLNNSSNYTVMKNKTLSLIFDMPLPNLKKKVTN